jgi:hypothetical protein
MTERHDLLDWEPLIRLEPGLAAVAPNNASDDHMVAAVKLNQAPFGTRSMRMDH